MNNGFNYTLRYRKLQDLLDAIAIDLRNYDMQNLLEPAEIIKIVFKCNYDLGLRVYSTNETTLDVREGVAKLPDSFFAINFALFCGDSVKQISAVQGKQISMEKIKESFSINNWIDGPQINPCDKLECDVPKPIVPTNDCSEGNNVIINNQMTALTPNDCCLPCDSGVKGINDDHIEEIINVNTSTNICPAKRKVYLDCKGDMWEVYEIHRTETLRYRWLIPLDIDLMYSDRKYCDGCFPLFRGSPNKIQIRNGWLYCAFKEGKIYINYQGYPEDEDGEIMVPDHPMLNEYYEYAVKLRIFENLLLNGDEVSDKKLQLTEMRYREARRIANGIVNTPSFREMALLWEQNRKMFMNKYYGLMNRHIY